MDDTAEHGMYKLKIDSEFRKLIPPLSPDELRLLEENIVRDGCREPLCVWYNTILDGHNRYEICTRLQIPFAIQRVYPKNREEAIAWICTNQLGRRNISDETRKYLIGKRYEMEKILGAHNAKGSNQHLSKEVRAKMLPEPTYENTAMRTRERLGDEYNISHASIFNYGKYSRAIDELTKVVPELVPKILSGEVKIPRASVVELSQLPVTTIRRLSQLSSENETEFIGSLRKAIPARHTTVGKHLLSTGGSVKEMPAFDPDAEISGLTLTIPSWISSINRARSSSDLSGTTASARLKLENELLRLREIIDSIIAELKEVI